MERWLGGHAKLHSVGIAWVTGDGAAAEILRSGRRRQKGRVEDSFAEVGQRGMAELGMKLTESGKIAGVLSDGSGVWSVFCGTCVYAILSRAKGLVPWKLEELPQEEIESDFEFERVFFR